MTQEEMIKDIHSMLVEILAYIRKVDSKEYKEAEDSKNLAINLLADILVEGFSTAVKRKFQGMFKFKN